MKKPWSVFPQQFLERIDNMYPDDQLKQEILSGLSTPRPTTLRLNTIKVTRDEILANLDSENVVLAPSSFLSDVYILISPTLRDLTQTSSYINGLIYVQSFSSMIPPLVLDPQKNEKILDITAAPGSKTTQIASIMANSGEIVANDLSWIRIQKLNANLKIQGVTNTRVTHMAGQILWQQYPEYFDRALVDVPCSMEGRFVATEEKSYLSWSTQKIKKLSEEQKFLLRSAISSVKPGGIIVYSTCTLSPEENESIIDWIIRKEKGAIEVDTIQSLDIPRIKSISAWNTRQYHPDVVKTLRVSPTNLFEGFFVAKLKKNRSTVPRSLMD